MNLTVSQPHTMDCTKVRQHKKSKDNRDRNFVGRSMYGSDGFSERRDLEQYFWTDNTIQGIKLALQSTFDADNSLCLCTPTIAHTFWMEGVAVSLLDVDKRFEYLPKFQYFDLRFPTDTDLEPECSMWRVIVFDPPFFYIPMDILYKAVMYICKGNVKQTKLLVGFLKREERLLLQTFQEFNLRRTNFCLEYAHVKSNKWVNYAMYSNVDLPGIKRFK
ncbi:hypothetical protein HA402_002445 [Bradysia odoriphaga]|nr:hypothetical protein HA402_002445 [Bradysia odoriphaga]